MIEITNKIFYVGVNDRNKAKFEGLWPLPNGVSYNSYLIDDDKVVLIDTVEVDFFVQFIENIREVLGDRKIDYLVIHHMEPDHSGGLALLKEILSRHSSHWQQKDLRHDVWILWHQGEHH